MIPNDKASGQESSSFILHPSSFRPSFILHPSGHPSSFRRGFTLVELLIVITIIGMLAALVSVAAVKAINTATNTKILTEIGMLDAAMQSYKDNVASAYPPDFTVMINSSQGVTNRQNRILSHIRKAFPRLIVANGYGPVTTQGTLQFLVQNAFTYYNSNPPPGSSVTYSTYPLTGGAVWGDIDNLDPAEAIVFWLGGPPAPPIQDPATGKWLFTLRGFSASKVGNAGIANSFGPFSLTDASRVPGPYEFQQSRLGDADGDGWPEYYPDYGDVAQPPGGLAAVANPMPPYVYFDATSYTSVNNVSVAQFPQSAVYPSPLATVGGASSGGPGLQPYVPYGAAWGTAMPYPQLLTTNSSGTTVVQWVNPQKFQIVCSGIDQRYWFTPATTLLSNLQLRPYPSGVFYSEGDLDNLTNFYTGMLKSAQP